MNENERPEPILLSPPHLGSDELGFVKEAFETNWIAPVGPNVDGFERELCEATGAGNACALSSGTAAIHLGLILLGVKPGDLVICSSLTFVASANPIRYCGAEPVFVDSDPDTWCMSLPALERVLDKMRAEGKSAKACVAVSLYGQAAPMPEIVALCSKHGVKVLDEAAEALGARCGGHMAGTFGDLGVYSFNGNKILTTSGGGVLVSKDAELVERARFLSTQARDPSPIGAYEHHVSGHNYRMSNVLAGIGRGQIKLLEARVRARQQIFTRYRNSLKRISAIEWMPEASYGTGTRWLSCCLLPNEQIRDEVLGQLQARRIDARPVWKPMHLQTLFQSCRYEAHENGCDVSRSLFERGLCLPSGSSLSTDEQQRVTDAIQDILG